MGDILSSLPTFIETAILAYAFYLMQQCGDMRYQVSKQQMFLQISANTAYGLSQFTISFTPFSKPLFLLGAIFVVCSSAFTLLVLIFSMTEIARIQLNYEQNYNSNVQDDCSEVSRSDLGDPLSRQFSETDDFGSVGDLNAARVYSGSFQNDSIDVSMIRMMENINIK